jgi:uncharacterized membrane protein
MDRLEPAHDPVPTGAGLVHRRQADHLLRQLGQIAAELRSVGMSSRQISSALRAGKVGGLLYFNPRDPAMWVENRVGAGYTLNVGNWRAWLLMIGIMLAPMIAGRLLF